MRLPISAECELNIIILLFSIYDRKITQIIILYQKYGQGKYLNTNSRCSGPLGPKIFNHLPNRYKQIDKFNLILCLYKQLQDH